MKKICFLSLLVFLIVLVSCEKDGNSNLPPIINPSASMSAKVSGASWTATTRVTVLFNNNFIITGTSIGGKVIEVSILGDSPGTYVLDPIQSITQMQGLWKPDGSSSGQNYISVRGTAELTAVDTLNKKISGNFEFVAARAINDTVYVQDGIFTNLGYTEQSQ